MIHGLYTVKKMSMEYKWMTDSTNDMHTLLQSSMTFIVALHISIKEI